MDMFTQLVLAVPGAFIRWLFLRKRRSFDDILHEDYKINGFVGGFTVIPLVLIILMFFW